MPLLTSRATSLGGQLLSRVGLGRLSQTAKKLLRHRSIRVDVDGLTLEAPGSAFRIMRRIENGTYERGIVQLFREQIRPGNTVLDVGAAIGYYALIASPLVGETGSVFAFEADPYAARALARNVAANAAHNVQVFKRAVAERSDEWRRYHVSATTGHSGFAATAGEQTTTTEVETVAIDDLNITHVDVVKIDVEGAELGVLHGMEATLARSPNATLFLEFNPPMLRANDTDPDELLAFLQERFAVQLVSDDDGLQPFDGHALADGSYVDLLCSPR